MIRIRGGLAHKKPALQAQKKRFRTLPFETSLKFLLLLSDNPEGLPTPP